MNDLGQGRALFRWNMVPMYSYVNGNDPVHRGKMAERKRKIIKRMPFKLERMNGIQCKEKLDLEISTIHLVAKG